MLGACRTTRPFFFFLKKEILYRFNLFSSATELFLKNRCAQNTLYDLTKSPVLRSIIRADYYGGRLKEKQRDILEAVRKNKEKIKNRE